MIDLSQPNDEFLLLTTMTRELENRSAIFFYGSAGKVNGLSVRCIRDWLFGDLPVLIFYTPFISIVLVSLKEL